MSLFSIHCIQFGHYTVIIVVDRMRMELVKEQLCVESHFWPPNISFVDDSLKSWQFLLRISYCMSFEDVD